MPAAQALDDRTRAMLALTLTPGIGPILAARLIAAFGSPDAALAASPAALERVPGIGRVKAKSLVDTIRQGPAGLERELDLIDRLAVRLIAVGSPDYPPLLAQIPNPPPLLYVRGRFEPELDRYPVAIVGSRRCTAYGLEQAERFAGVLGRAGLTIVSGGARGIDSAAHRGSLRAAGRTIAVMGCGLAHTYPPENRDLFEQIVAEGRGLLVSELPMDTAPAAENFPARNRIISGLSLGVIVLEAGRNSGSLITARLAGDDHGREVMAIPGRVDSQASEGTHALLKEGAAMLVTSPGDVLALLETPARHHHAGTHEARYALFGDASSDGPPEAGPEHADSAAPSDHKDASSPTPALALSPIRSRILDAL
ncbi:MAG: DNA-processing protein DprA, partial [Phycisphaerales bacterium]|nr:DNA-processing protein DprA [Phycisphaerales bacterium]